MNSRRSKPFLTGSWAAFPSRLSQPYMHILDR